MGQNEGDSKPDGMVPPQRRARIRMNDTQDSANREGRFTRQGQCPERLAGWDKGSYRLTYQTGLVLGARARDQGDAFVGEAG